MDRHPLSLLRYYSNFRGRVPSVREAFARQPFSYWLGLLVLLGITSAYYAFFGGAPALVFAGAVAGVLVRDLGWVLRFRRDWPTIDRALNWAAIEAQISASRAGGA
jgi:hypothetical protein